VGFGLHFACVGTVRRAAAAALAAGLALGPLVARADVEVPEGASAEVAASGPQGKPNARLRLLVERDRVRAGEPVRAGVLFDLTPGWHMYWRYSGQSGLPTELEWTVAGGEAGAIQWPAPEVFSEADGFITTYGYGEQVLLASELRFAPGASGAREVRVAADFLVCKTQCIPGKAELVRTVQVGAASAAPDADTTELFDRYAAQVPVSPDALGLRVEAIYSQSAVRPGDAFRAGVAVVPCAAEGASAERCADYSVDLSNGAGAFVSDRLAGIEVLATGARRHPFAAKGSLVTLKGQASPESPTDAEQRLTGVLRLQGPDGPAFVNVDLALPVAAAGSAVTANDAPWLEPEATPAGASLPLVQVLLFAFLGGLILNLMPCVFPVLALKLSGIAELAHSGRREVLLHGGAYTAGILLSMGALAAVVLGLRAAGIAVGWGFQFQEPLFVLAVGAVVVAFALNLFGVFEIMPDLTRVSRVGEQSTGTARSFFDGLLAVVLATPCSAPFMGTAVGFAFAGSGVYVVAIFLAIGLGLAAPYVAITLVPGLARAVPRPGMWMVQLRQVLGFSLLGTAVWLLWILGRAAGTDAAAAAAGVWLAVGFVGWIYGALQTAGRERAGRVVALAGAALLALGASALSFEPPPEAETVAAGKSWARAFEPAQIRSELQQGRPVFVYFTADWCLTCKANERAVLDTPEVQGEIARLGFSVFVGDWTRRDERIRSELARFGRAAVPLYLVYSPSRPEDPQLLSEILTVDTFIGALRRAAPEVAPVARTAQGESR
jgi:thiol:disulfide interchange protein/DsbC/DsbD-like thiol-disulfide interchange protein